MKVSLTSVLLQVVTTFQMYVESEFIQQKRLVTEGKNLLAVLQSNKYAPGEYTSGFQTAKAIFLHQTVINPADGTTIPLSPWEDTPDSHSQTSCGMYPLKYLLYLVYVGEKIYFQKLQMLKVLHASR